MRADTLIGLTIERHTQYQLIRQRNCEFLPASVPSRRTSGVDSSTFVSGYPSCSRLFICIYLHLCRLENESGARRAPLPAGTPYLSNLSCNASLYSLICPPYVFAIVCRLDKLGSCCNRSSIPPWVNCTLFWKAS